MSTKHKVIKARKAVREKLRLLRLGYLEREQTLRDTFKPVTESLGQLTAKISHDDDENAIEDFINRHSESRIDKLFGVCMDKKPYMLGNQPITLTENTIQIGDRRFQRTSGLLNLIFLRPLKSTKHSPEDLEVYREILNLTGVHRKNLKGQSSAKYKTIIKPILDHEKSMGEGIDIQHKRVTDRLPQYIYYDDPNELIDRLRLLMASTAAGNTAHTNEIASIVSELRERGIIE